MVESWRDRPGVGAFRDVLRDEAVTEPHPGAGHAAGG